MVSPLSQTEAEAYAAQLLTTEQAASTQASAGFVALRDAVIAALAVGALDRVSALLSGVTPTLVGDIEPMTKRAWQQGVARAQRTTGRKVGRLNQPARDDQTRLQTHALEGLHRANQALFRQDAEAVRGALGSALNNIRGTAAYAVNESAAHGQLAVADATGSAALWHAERNGCVHCLSRAGAFRRADGTFGYGPNGSFAAKPLELDGPLTAPPLHPHCRCSLIVGPRAALEGLASAMAREAARSVLRGDKLPSESEASRLQAAQRLLANGGAGLPKTVRERARRAVAASSFSAIQARRQSL